MAVEIEKVRQEFRQRVDEKFVALMKGAGVSKERIRKFYRKRGKGIPEELIER